MSATDQTTGAAAPAQHWITNQPYLLLSITALCWAGNAIVGRLAAGHIPPVTLSFLRWFFAFLLVLPFAWKHLVKDWAAIRSRLGLMIVLSITGIGAFNTLQYWALEHTQALNTLLLQSAAPLIVAISCMGMVNPNTIVGALARHQNHAGTASSVMGTGQYLLGAISGLLVGIFTDGTPRGMAALMLVGSLGMVVADKFRPHT